MRLRRGWSEAALRTSGLAARTIRASTATGATYTNPVIAQTTPDPAVIKALDGYYYVIATSDPWQGGAVHLLPFYRSTDLVHWTFVGNSFPARPAWVRSTAGLWAPDLRYYNHKYYLYYLASNTNPLPHYGTTGGSAIGVATADTPAGPWTDAGPSAGRSYQTGPIVPPRPCAFNTDSHCYYWTFDPAEFTDHDGQKYLYYGSYFGGTLVQKLQPDGLHTAGPAIQIGHWDHYEGTYVIRHDVNGLIYYYNFSSAAGCCRGPNTAYSVEVNRATSPLGPFVDQNGYPMMRPTGPAPSTRPTDDPAGNNNGAEGGGYPTLKQNGNRWNGVGHNTLIADLSGRDWIVYHGVDKTNGWVNGLAAGTGSVTFRQMLIDPVDWTADGWPVVNGGAGPSVGPNPGPDTTPLIGDNFNTPRGCAAPGHGDDLSATWTVLSGAWDVNAGTCTTGGYAEQTATSGQGLVVSEASAPSGYRAECDLRLETAGPGGRYGCVVSYRHEGAAPGGETYIAAFLDPTLNALVTAPYQKGHAISGTEVTPLPASFDHTDWHHLAIDEDISQPGRPLFRFTVSDRDRDPLAVQARSLPAVFGQYGGSVGFVTLNAHADFDNVTVALRDTTVAPQQQTPPVGTLRPAYSDDFNSALGPQWSWIREDSSGHALVTYQGSGQLEIMTNGDLYRAANNARNLLLETPPSDDYMVETKLTFDPNNNVEQAGLLVYADDDHYIKVGPAHLSSLSRMIAGHESLEPVPANQFGCDVQPSRSSNIAVTAYTAQQCPNEGESWDYLTNPQPTANGSTASAPTVTDWLRIYDQNGVYTPFYSLDDVHWVKGASWTLTSPNPTRFSIKIGLFAFASGTPGPVSVYFAYVHVYSRP
jgi:beta-xylosidase